MYIMMLLMFLEKNFFTLKLTEHWTRLPTEAYGFPFPGILRTHLDIFLCGLL